MKTIVLDDDPTGTQSASGVTVLLETSADILEAALRDADSVYVLTNTRALEEPAAVALLERIRGEAEEAAARLGSPVQYVLRGDSTLRGHVFAETAVFTGPSSVIVFMPAFPAGGRTTVGGVHFVRVGDDVLPAHESEYAADPVFPFSTGVLTEYVREKSGRDAVSVPVGGDVLAALERAAPGQVVLPDATTDDDIREVARAVVAARAAGVDVVVRSASPLAAQLAGVESAVLLPLPVTKRRPTLVVCGSHTHGATRQLEHLTTRVGHVIEIHTDAAMADASAEGERVAAAAATALATDGIAIIASERHRRAEHDTLAHGERVMAALTTAVAALRSTVGVVVSKGGITSADVAKVGLGAATARVVGQVLPGVSLWSLTTPEGMELLDVVVPGNVGEPSTISDALAAVGWRVQASAAR